MFPCFGRSDISSTSPPPSLKYASIEYLNMYLDKNPYCEVAWHQLGRQFYALKNYEKAIWAFDYACIIDESFLGAFLEKAKSLEKLQQYQEAIDCYMITIELDDPTSFAFLRIGKCYEKLGNNEQALIFYLKTVHEDPLLDKAWLTITDFYIKQENYQKSLYYINKAIGIDGENPLYWRRYATINQYLNFFEEAEEGYRKAFENGDVALENFISWSDVLYVLGEVNAAFEILNQAKELYPNDAEEMLKMFPHETTEEVHRSSLDLASIRFIGLGAWKWFDLHRKNSSKPVYRYLYSKVHPPNKFHNIDMATYKAPLGARHAEEVAYSWGNLHLDKNFNFSEDDFKVSTIMQEYFSITV